MKNEVGSKCTQETRWGDHLWLLLSMPSTGSEIWTLHSSNTNFYPHTDLSAALWEDFEAQVILKAQLIFTELKTCSVISPIKHLIWFWLKFLFFNFSFHRISISNHNKCGMSQPPKICCMILLAKTPRWIPTGHCCWDIK